MTSWVRINHQITMRNNVPFLPSHSLSGSMSPEDFYKALSCNYPKFFKMDLLCKWAWLASEILLHEDGKNLCEGMNKTKIGLAVVTSHGCIHADKKYLETLHEIPSPALFVYTLPNIMLGEISIRNGFKGEQICLVSEGFDETEIFFAADDMMRNRNMEACICGWIDIVNEQPDIVLYLVWKNPGSPFSPEVLKELFLK